MSGFGGPFYDWDKYAIGTALARATARMGRGQTQDNKVWRLGDPRSADEFLADARAEEKASQEPSGFESWTPTAENVRALPGPVRDYVHDIETRCDPAGEVRERAVLQDYIHKLETGNLSGLIQERADLQAENEALRAMIAELKS